MSSPEPEKVPLHRQLTLRVDAASDINVSPDGVSQPVKMCVVELNQEDWTPPGLYQGRSCSDISPGTGVLSVAQFILLPQKNHHYQREVPWNEERWLLVAAEFQNPDVGNGLIKLKSEARLRFSAGIQVSGNQLSVQAARMP
ncbi:type VI secretion system lipoprotein TssJ [Enterobacteriaceae bacterium 4M9]|nr:type VI secretion system lipoprotein TssJ [Enterobacteriaceae bacterium 4M9]